MALFRYEAVDRTGKVVRGAMNASDEQQVARNLAAMGYTARNIFAASVTAFGNARPAQAASISSVSPACSRGNIRSVTLASGLPVSVKSSVPPQVLAGFFRHLATLVKSGYPIGRAIAEMESVTRNPRLRRVLPVMRESTQSGRSLSSLMAEYPRVFPVHTVASVWCGEMSGRLEVVLEKIAQDLEEEASDDRRSRIGWGLVKITLLVFVILVPMTNMVALLMPTLEETLARGGQISRSELIARVVQTFVKEMLWKSLLVIVLLVTFWLAWGALKRLPFIRRMIDGALLLTPVWGKLHRERALARFFHMLGGMIEAGVGLSTAWNAASLSVRNSAIAERLRVAMASLPSDASISQLLEASRVFDSDDIAAAASGEKAGRVPEVLAARAAAYADIASGRKIIGKLASGTLFTTTSLILAGYIMYRVITSYFDLVFKVEGIIGR
ncbi:MAG: type II secretion system F family protein [Armatimonadetes bacterium]|nr:type II secretion system F family protein [Armatimonadota bacterium]